MKIRRIAVYLDLQRSRAVYDDHRHRRVAPENRALGQVIPDPSLAKARHRVRGGFSSESYEQS
jgi:hypothetical protein